MIVLQLYQYLNDSREQWRLANQDDAHSCPNEQIDTNEGDDDGESWKGKPVQVWNPSMISRSLACPILQQRVPRHLGVRGSAAWRLRVCHRNLSRPEAIATRV